MNCRLDTNYTRCSRHVAAIGLEDYRNGVCSSGDVRHWMVRYVVVLVSYLSLFKKIFCRLGMAREYISRAVRCMPLRITSTMNLPLCLFALPIWVHFSVFTSFIC